MAIYSGNSNNPANLVQKVCGSLGSTIAVPAAELFVEFVTNAAAPHGGGFNAQYSTYTLSPCSGLATLTDPLNDVARDGYFSTGYTPGMTCSFLIQPATPTGGITLEVNLLDLDSVDKVRHARFTSMRNRIN